MTMFGFLRVLYVVSAARFFIILSWVLNNKHCLTPITFSSLSSYESFSTTKLKAHIDVCDIQLKILLTVPRRYAYHHICFMCFSRVFLTSIRISDTVCLVVCVCVSFAWEVGVCFVLRCLHDIHKPHKGLS